MRLGIETEFLLAARHGDLATDLNEFVRVLAANHNAKVGSRHRRMRRFLRDPEEEDDYKLWSMAYEQTNATGKSPCKPFPSRVSLRITPKQVIAD